MKIEPELESAIKKTINKMVHFEEHLTEITKDFDEARHQRALAKFLNWSMSRITDKHGTNELLISYDISNMYGVGEQWLLSARIGYQGLQEGG